MRAELLGALSHPCIDADRLVRLVVRAQLDAVEQSGGDPAFFTEKRYGQSEGGLGVGRDRLSALDVLVKDRQMAARDVASLIRMLDAGTTRMDALSALACKGEGAAPAVPRLVGLLREADQQECWKVLQALAGIGPAARGAVPAVVDLIQAQAALRAISPERAAELGAGG